MTVRRFGFGSAIAVASALAWVGVGLTDTAAAAGLSESELVPVARQAALDRAGFSPGLIDGVIGPKTKKAVEAFQRFSSLPVTGQFDDATDKALGVDGKVLVSYRVTDDDVKSVSPTPTDWNAKAKLKRLGYESLPAALAEQGHCTIAALKRFNPKVNWSSLSAGDTVMLPRVSPARPRRGKRLIVSLNDKTISVVNEADKIVALFHCSIAKDKAKRPSGNATVSCIVSEPEYTFDPKKWPEVKNVKRVLTIPAGPRNPVGMCWIGLSLDGYGMHGTPTPEMIGKTGSHGCFRLANWDAIRLGKMIRVGAAVEFK